MLIKVIVIISPFKTINKQFCNIVHLCRLFTSQYIRYGDSVLIIVFLMLFLLALIYRWIVWHIPPPIPFFTFNSISASANSSNTNSVFFKHAVSILVQKMWPGQSLYILIHLLQKLPNISASNDVLLCRQMKIPYIFKKGNTIFAFTTVKSFS